MYYSKYIINRIINHDDKQHIISFINFYRRLQTHSIINNMFSSPHSPSKKSDFPSKISGSKSIGTSSTLTGVKDKLGRCRRCCFRNGLYPMAIAPFVTLAWLVDLYCCTGCDLLNIDVGFEPSNDVWKNPNINLGLFFYQNRETDTDINEWMDRIHNSCQSYDSTFEEYFIEGDQTWLVRLFYIVFENYILLNYLIY